MLSSAFLCACNVCGHTRMTAKDADRFLAHLSTDDAQNISAKYGFIKASTEELRLKKLKAPAK